MKEYQKLLDKYYGTPSWDTETSDSNGTDMAAAKKYMSRYWLSTEIYLREWKSIQERVFTRSYGEGDSMFPDIYDFIAMRGGNLFIKEEFLELMECFKCIDDEYFVVAENSIGIDPPFRFIFPTDISWDEFKSGDFISTVFNDMPDREYSVFTKSAKILLYAASDHPSPLNLIAFVKSLRYVFKDKFKVSRTEWLEIHNDWLPQSYKRKILNNSSDIL